jgi:UDP-GlcNAc:undecaprenyl-phosphate/decaprenyl-phosphate GlcNAc-1-phosphate transferase
MHEYALVLLVTAAVTYLLTPLVRQVAIVTHTVHEPRARDIHTRPTPLLGGLAMYGGLIAGLILAGRLASLQDPFASAGSRTAAGLLLAGGLLVVVGFIDDRWGLSAVSKLAGQVAAGGILVWSGQSLPWVPMPSGGVFALEPDLSVTLTILLVVVTINAINFIDGLDGLAAGIVAVSALSFLAYSYTLIQTIGSTSQSLPAVSSALLAGMCLGFLPHNFYPARIFMGDIGASLLGLLLAYLPISSIASLDPALLNNYAKYHPLDRYATLLPLLVPAAIFVIPYADLMFAIIRRTRAGKPLMAADRQHLHHRVLNIGHSYRQSVLIMYLWAALFSVTVVSLSVARTRLVVLEAATVIAVLTLLPVTMPRLRPWRLVRTSRAAVPAAASRAMAGPAAPSRTAGAHPPAGVADAPGARRYRAATPPGARPAGQALNGAPPSTSPLHRAPFPGAAPFPDAPAVPSAAPLPGDQLPRAGRLPGTEPVGPFGPGYPVAPVNPFPGPHEQSANGHLAYPDPLPAPDPFPGPGPATADGPPDGPDSRARARRRDIRPR